MHEIIERENVEILDMIYEINGKDVMLDSDLARIYKCKNGTKEINQAVKNNPNKFPLRYSWVLTDDESRTLLVKNFDQKNIETRGGRFKNPRVFTEEGVAMLATILHTKVAVDVSIAIMDAFVKMRHFIIDNNDIYISLNNINNILIDHGNKIDYLFSIFDKKEKVLLKNEPFTAYKTILDVLNTSKKEIIIVDNYADINLLDLIRNIKRKIILITKNSNRLSDVEIKKYNMEYSNLNVIRNNDFHDRYIVIDNIDVFLLGSSFNNIGEKITTIVKLEDIWAKKTIIDNICEIMKKNT